MTGYWLMILLHVGVLCVIGWWYTRAYRKAAHRSRRELERLLVTHRSAALEAEVAYIRRRHDILLRGLFPNGDVYLGAFIDEDPELRALCDLLDLARGNHATRPSEHPAS